MLIRAVETQDFEGLLKLAKAAGIGMTSLPADVAVLEAKIHRAVRSFAGECEYPGDESYLFVLEDPGSGELVGTCGVVAHVGLKNPFYSYKLSTITAASKAVEVFSSQNLLSVVNDYTGASELGSLFLLPDYRRDRIGRFLSRMRLVFVAEFRERFDDRMIAEIRGVQREDGTSPFYDALAAPFFQMPFQQADYINATQGNQFITDLMPRYPIYTNLLSEEARAVIGEPLPSSKPAMAMLDYEGMTPRGYVDIFDGGPTVEGITDKLHTVQTSQKAKVAEVVEAVDSAQYIVINTQLDGFRAATGGLEERAGGVRMESALAEVLQLQLGDAVRYVKL